MIQFFNLLDAYFANHLQDGVHGQSTGQIMVLGPGIASLVLFSGDSCTKNDQWGLLLIWPCTVLIPGGCIHNLGYLNGVALQPHSNTPRYGYSH